MNDPYGTVRQGLMAREADATRGRDRHFAPVRGQVVAVTPRDSPKNAWGVTLVDLSVGGFYATTLYNVPTLSPKANLLNGEHWSPQIGDRVLVGFIDGMVRDPVVYGCFSPPRNALEPVASETPLCRRVMNLTSETIEKDGTRRVHVAKDEVLEVVGDGTVTVGGGLTVTVTGDAKISATGTATVLGSAVRLGGEEALQRLIDERILAYYDLHTHPVAGIATGGGSVTSAPPLVPLTPLVAGIATTATKAV